MAAIEMQIQNRLADTVGEERVGWIVRVAWKYKHLQIASGNLLYAQGTQTILLWQPKGWDVLGGEREVQEGETYVYLWLIHVDVWQKSTQYCKTNIHQLKNNNFFKCPKRWASYKQNISESIFKYVFFLC